jgi:hypothetical protein
VHGIDHRVQLGDPIVHHPLMQERVAERQRHDQCGRRHTEEECELRLGIEAVEQFHGDSPIVSAAVVALARS